MKTKGKMEKNTQYLEKRVQYLEDVNRFAMDGLETAAFLGDFQPSIRKLQDFSIVLDETTSRIRSLMRLEAIAFYLVDENNNEFVLSKIDPKHCESYIEEEVGAFINKGIFAWALREKRPVVVSTEQHKRRFIFHVMITSSRIRGMFVGLLEKGDRNIPDMTLSILSIILLNSSNALENYKLFNLVREINDNLQKKENYKMLFEAAPDGVEVLDAKGNIVDCNKAQTILLGYKREELIGNNTTKFLLNYSTTSFKKKLHSLKKAGHYEGEVELVSKAGDIIPVWRKESAIYDENMKFVGYVVYNRNLSDRKAADKEQKRLQDQLQRARKMEAIGTLVGGVAHDLNNVLGGIVSYPDLLLMQIPEDSPLRKPILTIQKSGEKAAAIVQDLLALARRGVSVTEVVNLNNIISDYLKTPEHERIKSFHPHLQLEIDLEENLLNMIGSPVHLSKTIMNLIINAAEAMPSGGKVLISTENQYIDRPITGYDNIKEGDYVTLTISDEGIGILEEDLEKIFEPFYTKKVMGKSGTGLGMAVVWGTVKDHNGYINIQSAEGKGTTITIYFPVTRKELKKDAALISIKDYMGKGEAILIADDVEEQREIASGMLSRLGYTVTTVSSGEEAVEYLKKSSADLLLLDMIMDPGIDGLETYRRILKIHPDQKALIASGFSETKRVMEAQRLGAGSYIKKPFVLEQIGMAVKHELEG